MPVSERSTVFTSSKNKTEIVLIKLFWPSIVFLNLKLPITIGSFILKAQAPANLAKFSSEHVPGDDDPIEI
ncbi:hypothetical protein DICVIV_09065 [Dictyocaulus viviparus]|uniref:Uncharacterized protein n=1 Tax=Dictyocaulus viviparus TaxID=29172 RepID=A0A0D8XMD4_DICVI|nr:hypothetical protein DICVIV_09065 [Dictyocaulus viviparus]